jgi:glycosyltransferase involved in cell wall biosynthesis
MLSYALVTPAHNEEVFIEKTIRSVLSQTVGPVGWVIVNDGSSDRTAEIVEGYLEDHPWIELLSMPPRRDRHFAGKALSFSAGYERLKALGADFDIIGSLDADLSFEKNYFEFLLRMFEAIPDLGVAGTPFVEESGYSSARNSFEGHRHVAGACQLFRRECFEAIGGYVPHKAGGIDWIAVTTARMKGWKTRSFREREVFHHRRIGTAERGPISANFAYGEKDYYLGGHPLWEAFRVAFRCARKPYLVGGLSLGAGYLWAAVTRVERPVSKELMRFHRREQMEKLRLILKGLVRFRRIDPFALGSGDESR